MKIVILGVISAGLLMISAPRRFNLRSVELQVGKGPRAVAIADVNHDGKPDLIVTNADDGTVTVLLGDGKGGFKSAPGSPFPAGPQPNDIGIGDMDGDGNLDLVIPNHQSPYITVLLGDGKGSFRSAPGSPFDAHSHPHPHGVAVADFNGDGKLDVVTDDWGNNRIELLLGNGKGGVDLPGTYFGVGRRPYQRLRTADFNHDGHPDIITTNLDDDTVSVLLGDGKGGFHDAPGSPVPAGAKPWALTIGDLNHDGNLDLIVVPYVRDVKEPKDIGITMLLGDGKGGFKKMPGSPLPLPDCSGTSGLATGDLKGDSLQDIVVTCANNKMYIFLGKSDGSFETISRPIEGGWGGVAVGDLNGDGKADIVVANELKQTVTIFLSH